MSAFGKSLQRLSYGLNLLAGCFLVGMTALTCADVILRIFKHPILGSYEIVGFMGATAAGFALAYTTLKRGHVAVSVLVALLPARLQKLVYLITKLISMILFALLSLEFMRYGNDLKSAGEVSLTLELPFFPVLYGLALSAFVVCLVQYLDFWRVLTGKERPWYLWKE